MEFVKFNSKHFSILDIFDFTLIFRISTRPKTAKKCNSLARQLISLWRLALISKSFSYFWADLVFSSRFSGRFGILWPIRWPFRWSFRYSWSDSVFLRTRILTFKYWNRRPIRYSRADSVAVSVVSGRFGGRFGILEMIRYYAQILT